MIAKGCSDINQKRKNIPILKSFNQQQVFTTIHRLTKKMINNLW
jgi:hypothetical protein